jgi:hypothetical protein
MVAPKIGGIYEIRPPLSTSTSWSGLVVEVTGREGKNVYFKTLRGAPPTVGKSFQIGSSVHEWLRPYYQDSYHHYLRLLVRKIYYGD